VTGDSALVHASCVALADGRGVLILGPSGSGKSALALRLIALGAMLVADDRTIVTARKDALHAACPDTLRGRIEARGVGILSAPALPFATLKLAVDLGRTETERLPRRHLLTLLGTPLELVLGSQSDHFPAAVLCYLRGRREA
jgi:HPr kinase/phosphorylase